MLKVDWKKQLLGTTMQLDLGGSTYIAHILYVRQAPYSSSYSGQNLPEIGCIAYFCVCIYGNGDLPSAPSWQIYSEIF